MDKKTKILELKKELKIYKTCGENYQRFGNKNDGGYIIVNDLSKNDFAISCGIGNGGAWAIDFSAEYDLSKRCGGINMYELAEIDAPDDMKNASLFQAEIGENFGLSEMLKHVEIHNEFILKMDIEGAEWVFFKNAESSDINKFRQMIVEFHNIANMINDDIKFNNMISIFRKINKTHRLVLVHPNNHAKVFNIETFAIPNVVEVLFLRKDSYNFVDVDYPEYLTSPCKKSFMEIEPFYR